MASRVLAGADVWSVVGDGAPGARGDHPAGRTRGVTMPACHASADVRKGRGVSADDFEAALQAARRGEEAGVAVLYRALQPALLRYLRRQAPDAAEDLASETWLALGRQLGRLPGGLEELRILLFTIARRRVADHYRARGRAVETVPLGPEAAGALSPSAEQVAVESLSAGEAVAALVSGLAPLQAEVVLLRVAAGLKVEEVAKVLGRSPGAVRVLQHRALKRLGEIHGGVGVTN